VSEDQWLDLLDSELKRLGGMFFVRLHGKANTFILGCLFILGFKGMD